MQARRASLLGRCVGLAFLLTLAGATSARAQFIPYFGKNKVKYDNFNWRIYKSPHFEISYPIPLILYKTHSEFEQTNLTPGFVPEGALAFTEPSRDRMVVPIDEP